MSTNAQTMLDQIDAALASNPGLAEIRYADGRTLKFDRPGLLRERAYWAALNAQQASGGLTFARLNLRGDG